MSDVANSVLLLTQTAVDQKLRTMLTNTYRSAGRLMLTHQYRSAVCTARS
jgi:hypothetical protein